MLRRIVAAHGEAATWRAGLETLGYPPTWCHTGAELLTLKNALNIP